MKLKLFLSLSLVAALCFYGCTKTEIVELIVPGTSTEEPNPDESDDNVGDIPDEDDEELGEPDSDTGNNSGDQPEEDVCQYMTEKQEPEKIVKVKILP